MHQTKKELFTKQWNQMLSLDFSNQIDKDEVFAEYALSKETGMPITANNDPNKK